MGIIRRIDSLGRIVIPKEIRDSLRIKNSDSLEINTEGENIILKRHSKLSNIKEIENIIASLIKEILKTDVLITDKDKYIVGTKKEYINKKITNKLLNIQENRKMIIEKTNEENILINPIISNGDVIGSIIVFTKNQINEMIINTVEILTKYLIKYVE